MFAQAGKLGIPGIVFACDTEPVVVTRSPHDWVTLVSAADRARQRRAAARHRGLPGGVRRPPSSRRLLRGAARSTVNWHGTHRLPDRAPRRAVSSRRVLAGIAPPQGDAPFTLGGTRHRPAGGGADDGRDGETPCAGPADDRAPRRRRVGAPTASWCRGAAAVTSQALERRTTASRCERGPEELKDLPQLLQPSSARHQPVDLSTYDTAIFAEIVDAPRLGGGRGRRNGRWHATPPTAPT